MIELPQRNPTESLSLADWLELNALLATDGNASAGDLDSALRAASYYRLTEDEQIEEKILEVFRELEMRAKGAAGGYPFAVHPPILQARGGGNEFAAYLFCLCLSYGGVQDTKIAPRLFEQLSCIAAQGYLQGDAVGFGWQRTELPSDFPGAIRELCNRMGEGEDFRDQSSLDRKDDGLDLVAWKDFIDESSSKVLLFGQCAAGHDWPEKVGELQPSVFWDQWMQTPRVSPPPIKCFFVPHRIESGEKWDYYARRAGVLFDRCRIAVSAIGADENYAEHLEWTELYIQQLRET